MSWRLGLSWVLQAGLAAMFLLAGSMKLGGDEQMVALFGAIGLGQWFRYLTGAIEVGAALALLHRASVFYGALLLVPTMLGAIATHVFIVGGSPAVPIGLLVMASVVAWIRRR
ncbi:MAG: DoxX family protein [Vicinamibacterales bacterium]